MKVQFVYEREVFKFKELEKKVRDDVVTKNKIADSEFIDASVEDAFRDLMVMKHIEFLDPRWSLGYCQGDGVSFDQKERTTHEQIEALAHILLPQHQAFRLVKLFDSCRVFEIKLVRTSHRYVHHNTFRVDVEWDCSFDEGKYKRIYELVERFASIYLAYLHDACHEFEKIGYGVIESFDEDYYAEQFESDQTLFFSDGSRVDIDSIANKYAVLEMLFPD